MNDVLRRMIGLTFLTLAWLLVPGTRSTRMGFRISLKSEIFKLLRRAGKPSADKVVGECSYYKIRWKIHYYFTTKITTIEKITQRENHRMTVVIVFILFLLVQVKKLVDILMTLEGNHLKLPLPIRLKITLRTLWMNPLLYLDVIIFFQCFLCALGTA